MLTSVVKAYGGNAIILLLKSLLLKWALMLSFQQGTRLSSTRILDAIHNTVINLFRGHKLIQIPFIHENEKNRIDFIWPVFQQGRKRL